MRMLPGIVLASLLSLSVKAGAAEKSQKMAQLEKITVGPYDNFQSAVSDDESVIYFTRSQNLSSQIMRYDMKSGKIRAMTTADTDAKNPALSPNGKELAFTYFRRDAKGDICLLDGEDILCVTGPGASEHSPFWVDNETLAFVRSNDAGTQSQLIFLTVKSKKTELVIEGTLYNPSLAKDGRTLVYKGKGNDLIIYDVQSRKPIRTLSLDLAGATGPAQFSVDGTYIYFAQYMLDSNRDLRLDGRDAAAIFRIPVDGSRKEPEQLTSLNQNCSYPFPARKVLYMTCAFEGALDVYRTALTGIVPTDWNQDDLWEAHRAARSYSDRILLLNHLHARFQLSERELRERTLSNFILWGEWMPAAYYADRLSTEADDFKIHKILLDTYASWEVLPRKENLGAFAQMIDRQRAQLQKLPATPLQKVALGYMDLFANRHKDALARADKIESDDGLTLYWLTQLVKLSAGKNDEAYRAALEKRLLNSELSEETRLYYLSRWLELLKPGVDPTAAVDALQKKVGQNPLLNDLLDHEKQLYRVSVAANREASRTEMRAIVERIKRLKDDYYGMRLLFNRGMIVLYQAKKSRELSTIMSLWLTYVKKDTKEYPFAIEALRQNSLDIAYRFYHSDNPQEKPLASGAFMDSIRTSDDLESHYQYALLHFGTWGELESAYNTMQKDGLIRAESRVFVETLRKILINPDKVDEHDLEEAAEALDQMSDDHIGVGTRYLFQGYLYHRLMLMTEKDFTFDRDLSDKAHRSYLFAIDAGWNNDRIKSAAYQNLGLLHSSIRNYSLAAEFFLRRNEMNYPSVAMKQAVLWLQAKAMYKSYRFMEAYQSMEEALKTSPQNPLPFQEKAAFYAWNAGKYDSAAEYYAKVMPALGDKARASLWLSHGFVLGKLKRWDEAEQALQKAITLSQQEKSGQGKGIMLVYQPIKVQFVALGLLARLQLPITKKISVLQRRLAMFPGMMDQAKNLHFQDETLSAQWIKETQDLARWQLEAGQKAEGLASLEQALRLTESHGTKYGHLAHTVFVSLKNLMILVRDQKLEPSASMLATLDKTLAGTRKEFSEEKNPAAEVRAKWTEVQLIALAFQLRQDPARQKTFADGSQSILAQDNVQFLEKEKPAIYAGLQGYRDALLQSLR
ncbi:MAG TPA: hypothetical protein VFO10_25325 [Oligoflexus sp.]|uniref:hypothetical protein n=1 Tax=Oligoflexus sp. TaxID=1971216 RepID=UPI002D7F5E60|nr:hypothetical protein [Oligoflexus sp.]HET9240611.1 hypothetical protein [Oligoflexus sp.]